MKLPKVSILYIMVNRPPQVSLAAHPTLFEKMYAADDTRGPRGGKSAKC